MSSYVCSLWFLGELPWVRSHGKPRCTISVDPTVRKGKMGPGGKVLGKEDPSEQASASTEQTQPEHLPVSITPLKIEMMASPRERYLKTLT